MSELLKITLIGLLFGTFGTTIGGIIGISLKNISSKFLSFILEFAAGLMMGVVCFDLIPEAMTLSNIINIFGGMVFGIIMMIVCDNILNDRHHRKNKSARELTNRLDNTNNSLLKMGMVISIGLAIHNFPEGLVIGAAYGTSIKLGISLAIAIALHDIPEGCTQYVM